MKKIIALLLAMIMVCGLATTAFADEPSYKQDGKTYTDVSEVVFYKYYNQSHAGTPGTSPAETLAFTVKNKSVTDAAAGITVDNMPKLTFNDTKSDVTYAQGDAGVINDFSNIVNGVPGYPNPMVGKIVFDLPTYSSVGVYKYTVYETNGHKAGTTYFADDIEITVTVVQDGDNGTLRIAAVHAEVGEPSATTKTDKFSNDYRSGELTIGKQVTGNLGDRQKPFTMQVTFSAPTYKNAEGQDVLMTPEAPIYYGNDQIAVDTNAWKDGGATFTFELKHDESIHFYNIPVGTTYVVHELNYTGTDTTVNANADGYEKPTAVNTDDTPDNVKTGKDDKGNDNQYVGYTEATDMINVTSSSVADGKINADNDAFNIATGTISYGIADFTDTDKVVITNEKKSDVDTGVALDSAPYFLMLAVAVIGMVALVSKKRYEV